MLHLVVTSQLILEQAIDLPLSAYGAIFLPLATISTITPLPLVKGGMIGVLFRLGANRGAGGGMAKKQCGEDNDSD